MMERQKAVAKQFVLGIGSSDLPDELFANDFSGWSTLSGDIEGEEFRRRALMMGQVFPGGLAFTVETVIGEGNVVALSCSSTGTVFDGKPYRNDYHYQFLFDDRARIRQVREYMNSIVAKEIIRPALAELARRQTAGDD